MGRAPKQIPKAFLTTALLLLLLAGAKAQDDAHPSPAGRISESLRVVPYAEAFYAGGVMPDWDRGYVIHYEIEMNSSPGAAMVVMYDASGKRVREGRIWPKGAGDVRIRRTAATHVGGILAGGGTIMQDGSLSGFIAKTDLTGNTVQSIATGAFKPEQLCEAPDGTVWSLGQAVSDGAPAPEADVVRQYSFEKGLLHSFLPEKTVRGVMNSSGPWFSPFGSLLRCGKEKVSVYLEFTDEYVEINTSSFAVNRWKIDETVVQGAKANGLAVTDDGRIYASFSAHTAYGIIGPDGLSGLYQLKAELGNPIAQLFPVRGTVSYLHSESRDDGAFLRLWGADGNQLAVWRAGEHGVSWVNVIGAENSD